MSTVTLAMSNHNRQLPGEKSSPRTGMLNYGYQMLVHSDRVSLHVPKRKWHRENFRNREKQKSQEGQVLAKARKRALPENLTQEGKR